MSYLDKDREYFEGVRWFKANGYTKLAEHLINEWNKEHAEHFVEPSIVPANMAQRIAFGIEKKPSVKPLVPTLESRTVVPSQYAGIGISTLTPKVKEDLIYIVGALGNPKVPIVGNQLRAAGFKVFDEWYGSGPDADKYAWAYEKGKGSSYVQALAGHGVRHTYEFDRKFLDRATAAVLVLPAGKSAHLELGIVIGSNRPGYVLLDGEPDRLDVMYNFATAVVSTVEQLTDKLRMRA